MQYGERLHAHWEKNLLKQLKDMEASGEVGRHHTHHAHFILKGGPKKKTAAGGKKKAGAEEMAEGEEAEDILEVRIPS